MALFSRFKKLFSSEEESTQETQINTENTAPVEEDDAVQSLAEQDESDASKGSSHLITQTPPSAAETEETTSCDTAPPLAGSTDTDNTLTKITTIQENASEQPPISKEEQNSSTLSDQYSQSAPDTLNPLKLTECAAFPEEHLSVEPEVIKEQANSQAEEYRQIEAQAQKKPESLIDAPTAITPTQEQNAEQTEENPESLPDTTPDASSEISPESALEAADTENEAEQESFFSRVFKSLARTRKRLAARLLSLFGANKIDDAFWEELEEILISADVGMEPTLELTKRLKARLRKEGIVTPAEVPPYLHQEIAAVFAPVHEPEPATPYVALIIGVNGVGKTTTIAKLAYMEKKQGKKVLIAAADTFRAAAVEQLETWAKRVGCRFYAKGQGADPAAVAYEALDIAQKENMDIVFVDTAGRLHTKTNLMEELLKIKRVLNKRMPGAPHKTILVMDATTGQNGLSQAKLFGESCGIDELILTKLDGTAKGGIAVAIAMQFGIPISHVGLGEGMRDLRPFEPETFTKAMLDTKE